MPDQPEDLKPQDFPIETDQDELKTHNGQTVGAVANERLARNVAQRLNEHADIEEQDRWSF